MKKRIMLWYNIKYAVRNVLKQKNYGITNIIGLSISLAAVFLILYYIQFETKFDQHFTNSKRVARFTMEYKNGDYNHHFARVRFQGIQYLDEDILEVECMTRLSPLKQCAVKIGQNKFYSKGAYVADPNYFKVFNDRLVIGNSNQLLRSKNEAIISESIRDRYFGSENPIGKQIALEHKENLQFIKYTIVGIMKNNPAQSHFHPEILTSLDKQDDYSKWNYTYLLLDKAESLNRVKDQFDKFKKKHLDKEYIPLYTFHLQGVQDIHLNSHKDREIEINGDSKSIKILILLALLISLVALINFANLNVIAIKERSKNILVNHLLGGKLQHIVTVAFFQNLIIIFLSLVIGLIMARIAYPSFQQLFSLSDFSISFSTIKFFLITTLLLVLFGSFIGTFPILKYKFMSNLLNSTSQNLKGKSGKNSSGLLLSLQFVIVTGLLITTFVINSQIQLLMENRLGGSDKNILNITNMPKALTDQYDVFKSKLLQISGVENVTGAMEEPGGEIMDAFFYHIGGITKKEFSENQLNTLPCDYNYLDFFNIELLAGRNFTPDPNKKQYILNKAALNYIDPNLSAEDFINRSFEFNINFNGLLPKGEIVGICDNLHLSCIDEKEKPLAIHYQNMVNTCISIRFTPEALHSVLPEIQSVWEQLLPNYAFDYQFIDDLYLEQYKQYINQRNFLSALSFLAILIACIGLIAISISLIQARRREISIRKINGAKTFQMVKMLNKGLLQWIMLALLLAFPLSWYVMNKWLQNFAYKTELSWRIFALAGLLAMGIALLTVSIQSWRAATRNPVESLRYE